MTHRLKRRVSLRMIGEEYGKIICYPTFDSEEMMNRISELETLKVEAIDFLGDQSVFGIPVLGKGSVGIVVSVHTNKGKAALKIRRLDANRCRMLHEAEMLEKANSVDVGPQVFDFTDNFMLMEFVEGRLFPEWIMSLEIGDTKARIRRAIRNLLIQCNKLDLAGIDHGELSDASKHIIVDKDDKPWIVDFETASINRKVHNFTSICQFLFFGSMLSEVMEKIFGRIDRKEMIEILREYKRDRLMNRFFELFYPSINGAVLED
jgi:putative serine/threonine protein kinase